MTHAQAGMAALLDVNRRPAEPVNQEIAEALLRARKIVGRIQGPQEIVPGNLTVERRDQPLKSFLADDRIYLVLFHYV